MNYKNCSEIENAISSAKNYKVRPKVAIHCITYNQGRFLSKCLDGFVSQKTEFPFVAIVHDDASTDDTAIVLKEYAQKYPEIIKPIIDPINRYTEHSLETIMRLVIQAYNPDYVAMCEGDDYWTDQYKLQKQVTYMDNNPDCSLCHGDVLIYEDKKKRFKGRKGIMFDYSNLYKEVSNKDVFWEILNDRYAFQTLTFMYRWSAYKNIKDNNRVFMMNDMPLLLDLSKNGQIKYFNNVFGVYNHNVGSATRDSSSRLNFDLSAAEMRVFYCEKYNYKVPPKIQRAYDRAYLRVFLSKGELNSAYKPFSNTIAKIITNYDIRSNISNYLLRLWYMKLYGYKEIIYSRFRLLYFVATNNTLYKCLYLLSR